MGRADRHAHLLSVMREVRAGASRQTEFTAKVVADRASVSVVTLYKVAGKEFKEMRSGLEGGRRAPDGELAELRRENEELRRENRELKEGRRETNLGELAGAIEMIEMLDEDNRMLRDRVALLERRLAESEEIVIPQGSGTRA
ncbi:MAG: hypothetical protein M3416_02760 [Acidobacteriota bacterium]|nr:hypothetical protein [Acidobacteriota bacterium]